MTEYLGGYKMKEWKNKFIRTNKEGKIIYVVKEDK